jgi:hypothetical protein
MEDDIPTMLHKRACYCTAQSVTSVRAQHVLAIVTSQRVRSLGQGGERGFLRQRRAVGVSRRAFCVVVRGERGFLRQRRVVGVSRRAFCVVVRGERGFLRQRRAVGVSRRAFCVVVSHADKVCHTRVYRCVIGGLVFLSRVASYTHTQT